MTIDAALRRQVEDVERVVIERHAKYGPTNVSAAPGGPLNGLRVRLHDKLARLNNFVDGGADADFDDDSLRDCFTDVVGYGLIGLLVLAGEWPSLHDRGPVDTPEYHIPPAVDEHPALRERDDTTWRWETMNGQTGYRWHDDFGGKGPGIGYPSRSALEASGFIGPLTVVPS